MPMVDGISVLRRLRKTHPQVPIVMLAAEGDFDLVRDALKLGAFDYVTKPFDLLHLAGVVEAAIAQGASSA
jgi:two-component system, NtrC family, nitrogen regulation response regulator GlnG